MAPFNPVLGWTIVIAWVVVCFFVGSAIFQWLWNITMPEAFGLKRIRYWIAFRLLIIAAFLTTGGLLNYKGHY